MRKCNKCKESKHMKKGLDTRWNVCYKCKPNLEEDPGDFIYSTSSKLDNKNFNDELEDLNESEWDYV